jgi:hypothetical protein
MNFYPIVGWPLLRNILAIRGRGIPQKRDLGVGILAPRPFTDAAVGTSPHQTPENTNQTKIVEFGYSAFGG